MPLLGAIRLIRPLLFRERADFRRFAVEMQVPPLQMGGLTNHTRSWMSLNLPSRGLAGNGEVWDIFGHLNKTKLNQL